MDFSKYASVCETLNKKVDLNGTGPPDVPFGFPFKAAEMSGLIQQGQDLLPAPFGDAYVTPLLNRLPSLVRQIQQQLGPRPKQDDVAEAIGFFEPLIGAVFDLTSDDVRPQLQRFEAVISDFYRSFLSKERRANVGVPLIEQLPPLATFAHLPDQGPFTITSDQTERNFQASVGVVSLPSSYRDHPILWAALAHETGGHDVTHADPGLLDELSQAVADRLTDQMLGQLWGYWIDEAASDVYGLLNVGPAFVFNLAAFFTTLEHQRSQGRLPLGPLSTRSFVDRRNQLDVHPTDILRVHLALGVIESLHGLSITRRGEYSDAAKQLAQVAAAGADTVDFVGLDENRQPVLLQSFPLATMQETARQVGTIIADAKLDTLGGHSIQEIETWDDQDESTAQSIATALLASQSVAGIGDDAQVLSGATLALFGDPSQYDAITGGISDALDASFARDPIFGQIMPHRIFFRPDLFASINTERRLTPPAFFDLQATRPRPAARAMTSKTKAARRSRKR
jgi:hypothetical protein